MFKLYHKAIAIVLGITLTGLLVTTMIMIPKVKENTLNLESQNAQLQLQKALDLVKSKEKELKEYKESTLNLHKIEVKSITQVAISILNTYYQEAKKSGSKIIEKQKKLTSMVMDSYNTGGQSL